MNRYQVEKLMNRFYVSDTKTGRVVAGPWEDRFGADDFCCYKNHERA